MHIIPANPPVAGTFTVVWDANSETDIAGYRLYQRTAAGAFGAGVDLGNVTQTLVTDIPPGETAVFAVTAYDTSGQESGFSVEVSPPNVAPMAVDDMVSIPAPSVTINLVGNDQDADNGVDPGSITIVDGPQHGTLSVNPDGTVTYTPNGGDSRVLPM